MGEDDPIQKRRLLEALELLKGMARQPMRPIQHLPPPPPQPGIMPSHMAEILKSVYGVPYASQDTQTPAPPTPDTVTVKTDDSEWNIF